MKDNSKNKIREFLIGKLNIKEMNKFESLLYSYYITKHHLDRLAHVADRILPFAKPGSKLLDLGSDGMFSYVAKSFVKDIDTYSLTLSDHTVFFSDAGRIYSSEVTGLDNLDLTQGCTINLRKCDLDKEKLPFEDNSIDIITCFEVLEHLYSDPMHMMLEVNRVLKKDGGLFFLSTPNINSLKSLKKLLSFESPYFWPSYSVNDVSIGHIKEYSIKELMLLFKTSGFSILNVETFDHSEDHTFSHNKHYQVGNIMGMEKDADDSVFENHLDSFLSNINWNRKFQGDYAFIMSQWNHDVKEKKYIFPIYESY